MVGFGPRWTAFILPSPRPCKRIPRLPPARAKPRDLQGSAGQLGTEVGTAAWRFGRHASRVAVGCVSSVAHIAPSAADLHAVAVRVGEGICHHVGQPIDLAAVPARQGRGSRAAGLQYRLKYTRGEQWPAPDSQGGTQRPLTAQQEAERSSSSTAGKGGRKQCRCGRPRSGLAPVHLGCTAVHSWHRYRLVCRGQPCYKALLNPCPLTAG